MPERKDPELEPLTRRDIWSLIFATYGVSLPYLLIFVGTMLFATWFFTAVVF